MPEDLQVAFPFVVMLHMEGRWRLVREGASFSPEFSPAFDFADGQATVTFFQQDDGGVEPVECKGPFSVAGGKLSIDIPRSDGFGYDHFAGAALVDPDVIAVVHIASVDFGDGPDIKRERFNLIREELAQALHTAEANWSQLAAAQVH